MFAATTLALLLAAAPGETYTLKWKLKEGDVFYNKTAVKMDQTIEVAGQMIEQKIGMKTVLKFKVKSVNVGLNRGGDDLPRKQDRCPGPARREHRRQAQGRDLHRHARRQDARSPSSRVTTSSSTRFRTGTSPRRS